MKTFLDYTREIFIFASKHNCNHLLDDLRKVKVTFSTLTMYEVPKMVLEMLSDKNPYSFKRAILVSESERKIFDFFETVAFNNGLTVKVFYHQNEAQNWLSL
ncbi:MAG: hypothetical protein ACFFFH_00310 [Candidatus Thorarchaeota archaeon]